MQKTVSTDLSREMLRGMSNYGIRLNLMYSISREQVPMAEFPRTNVSVIGDAFDLTNTTDQDPNVKWFVVGSSEYKKAIYPQILQWGFDMAPCDAAAEKKGYPYCGPNALYNLTATGSNPNDRERSDLFKSYENQTLLESSSPAGDDAPVESSSSAAVLYATNVPSGFVAALALLSLLVIL